MATQVHQATTAVPAGSYSIDPAHSRIGFAVRHLGIATIRGHFGSFSGTLEVGDDLASAKAHGSVETASVDTRVPRRDDHLRSADFFDSERVPLMEFESRQIRPLDDGSFEVVGDLTLRGVTRELTLSAEYLGSETDPWGAERVGLEARGELNRQDYGMTFNQALGTGNALVSDKVKLEIEVSAVKQT
jgi:polyisoprenoid-binding protein YceI